MNRLVALLFLVTASVPAVAEAQCDVDGDGHNAIVCGGDDCDDNDGNRYPGNVEVCDFNGHDEDCNFNTPGLRDADGDGFNDVACYNTDSAGTVRSMGDDCNDMNSSVHPIASEVCNGYDDNCDGAVDENVTRPMYVDADGDGFGTGSALALCPASSGYADRPGDCNDANPAINPGAQICTAGGVLVCLTSGTYDKASCQRNAFCHTQPNGTGTCECRFGINRRTGACR